MFINYSHICATKPQFQKHNLKFTIAKYEEKLASAELNKKSNNLLGRRVETPIFLCVYYDFINMNLRLKYV